MIFFDGSLYSTYIIEQWLQSFRNKRYVEFLMMMEKKKIKIAYLQTVIVNFECK